MLTSVHSICVCAGLTLFKITKIQFILQYACLEYNKRIWMHALLAVHFQIS